MKKVTTAAIIILLIIGAYFVFYQDIYRIPDNKPILKGKIIGTALSSQGRPFLPDEVKMLIEKYSIGEVNAI